MIISLIKLNRSKLNISHSCKIYKIKSNTSQQKDIEENKLMEQDGNLADIKLQLGKRKHQDTTFLFFIFIVQEFKYEVVAINQYLKKTQILSFRGLNEVQDDFNYF